MEKMLVVMVSDEDNDTWVDSVWTVDHKDSAKERAIYIRNNTRLEAAVIAYKTNTHSDLIFGWDMNIQEMVLDWDKLED